MDWSLHNITSRCFGRYQICLALDLSGTIACESGRLSGISIDIRCEVIKFARNL